MKTQRINIITKSTYSIAPLLSRYLLTPIKYFLASKVQDILIIWVNKLTKHKKPVPKKLPVNQSPWYKLLILIAIENGLPDIVKCSHGMNLDQLIPYANQLSTKYRIPLTEVLNYRWV